ncbi:MAG: DUF2088 domain-containing protein [Chloroflexi bacterium]|nr:DUF2088 domain-containing protein [Chloroflexota bacterium]
MSAYPTRPIPRLARVRQHLPNDRVADVAATVRAELDRIGLARRLRAGQRVALTGGSRGIADIALVLRTVGEVVRAAGAEPFLVTAMGSHGGATAEGQRLLLGEYGMSEQSLGMPIRATMDTVVLGELPDGTRVYFDAEAAAADATIVVNRVKAHTAFRGPIESGLSKMTAIGLGKQLGAEQVHSHGLRDTIPAAATLTLRQANVRAGVALVENAAHQLAVVRATPPEAFLQTDEELLKVANGYLPRVPVDNLHLLVVGWIGKNLSGSGMDYNVVGMWRRLGGPPEPGFRFDRIVVLDLTDASHGNGLGVGIADFTTRRLYEKLDLPSMYLNGLTSNALGAIKIPVVLHSDAEAIGVALHTVNQGREARLVAIRNTLELEELWVSEALLPEIRADARLQVVTEPVEPPFDQHGRLMLVAEPQAALTASGGS